MTAILAIETSTLTASVALVVEGKLAAERHSGVNSHSELLLPLIDECLSEAGLVLGNIDTIAIGAGPGSFTGLRIGMATAKGLCFATGIPLTPVSSLAALAFDCFRATEQHELPVLAVLDARRGEIFTAAFRFDGSELQIIGEEQVMAPGDLANFVETLNLQSEVVLAGDGALKYAETVASIGRIEERAKATPSASSVALLAQSLPKAPILATAAPSYVRLSEAEIKFPNGNTGGTFSVKGKS